MSRHSAEQQFSDAAAIGSSHHEQVSVSVAGGSQEHRPDTLPPDRKAADLRVHPVSGEIVCRFLRRRPGLGLCFRINDHSPAGALEKR
jgi:hypothetical protein